MATDPGVMMDIIGFGALNVDVIAGASGLSERAAEEVSDSISRFEWNRETATDRESILEAISHLGASSLNFSLGGSAWLTIYALAQMKLNLRLGYIGTLGRIEAPGVSFRTQMAELGIDHRWVGSFPSDNCGVCLSFIDDTERVMHTNPGANLRMSQFLADNFDGVSKYLARARFVHLTSFLDSDTPKSVLAVLRRAKELNPALKVSIDPGFDWSDHPSGDVIEVLRLADLLFVNFREFKALGRYRAGESDAAVARNVLAKCAPGCSVFVTKRYDCTEVFRGDPADPQSFQFRLNQRLQSTEVEDATGAGDVFSAAVLGALAAGELQMELGAYLGLALARHKMQATPGTDPDIPSLSEGFLQVNDRRPKADVVLRRVLLLHDSNPYWETVRQFLQARCGIEVDAFTPSAFSDGPAEVAHDRLGRYALGVCILGASPTVGRSYRPNQALIHMAGMLQGKYGFGRVAIIVERGCDVLSNLSGLIRLEFPSGNVEAVLVDLHRMVERELPAPGV
jgi:sugar/nucleoside kinase (ribokinase family)